MAFRVDLNRKGVLEMLLSAGMGDAMLARAERVAASARGAAPVVTGTYRNSIKAEVHKGRSRVSARAIATADYAQSVEARHRVLGRAIDAARSV